MFLDISMPLSVTGAPYWTLRTDSRAVPSLAYPRYQNLLTVGTTNAYYSELVRKTVQDTINALLEEEADEMVGAERYERTAGREAYRSGHYKRKLVTTSGEVVLDVPKLRGATFQRSSTTFSLGSRS